MPKVTITDTQGLVESLGSGVEIASNVTFTGTVLGVSPDNTSLVVGVDGTATAAGSSASDATPMVSGKTMYMVSSDADTKGVKINATDAVAGKVMIIINDSSKKCKVYPNSGATIDGTTSYTIDNGKTMIAGYYATNKWFVIKTA